MRSLTVCVAVTMAIVAVSAANAQSPRKPDPTDPNDNSKRLFLDGLPLVMPSAVMLLMLAKKEQDEKASKPVKKPRK